jgi:hypothetical protein
MTFLEQDTVDGPNSQAKTKAAKSRSSTRSRKKTPEDGSTALVPINGGASKTSGTAVSSQEFKKHVAAIHTSGELSLLERKAANVLLLNAFDNLGKKTIHEIPLRLFCSMVGWEDSNDMPTIKKALRKIATTLLEYNVLGDGPADVKWSISTLLAGADIEGGIIRYEYSSKLAEKLADPDIYAVINIAVQKRFKGGYSLTLYENCVRFKKTGSTGFHEVEKWRKLLGATGSAYDEFKYFNNLILKRAIEEINEVSDITIEPEFQRENRKVSHIRFLIEEKRQRSLLDNNIDEDELETIRQKPVYQRLLHHGIGPTLALSWVMQDEEKAKQVVDQVEEKDKKGEIRNSGGYIRRLIESADFKFGPTAYQKKKEAQAQSDQEEKAAQMVAKQRAEQEEKVLRKLIDDAIKQMDVNEICRMVQAYEAGVGKGMTTSFNNTTGAFKNAAERIAFNGWLRPEIKKRVLAKS